MVIAILALTAATAAPALAGEAARVARLITGKDVRNESLTNADIRNGSLLLRDVKTSERAKLNGATGPTGAAGPTGATGVKGDTGVPGPTASVTLSDDPSDIALPTILSLPSLSGIVLSKAITVSFPARLIANASAAITNPAAASATQVACMLELGIPANGTTAMSQQVTTTVGTDATLPTPTALAVTGSADVEAGTHQVSVRCTDGIGFASGGASFAKGDLAVIATAR